MNPVSHLVAWSGGEVTARVRGAGDRVVLLAHGAGTDQDHTLVVSLAEGLASRGLVTVTFNYPYTEAGRRAPDRAPKLLACHRDVAAWIRDAHGPDVVFAGRSMGGRMASMLAAEGESMIGLVLYAYPLHPAGKPDRLRAEHLSAIEVPMLFFQGTRDALASSDLFDRHIRSLPRADVREIEGADHSWRVRGRTLEDVVGDVVDASATWIRHLATIA